MTQYFLITGARDWPESHAHIITDLLDSHLRWHPDSTMLNGMCPTGADKIAYEWAVANGVPVEKHYADWAAKGRSAGPQRNTAMVNRLLAEGSSIAFAFFYGPKSASRGTMNTYRTLVARGVEPIERQLDYVQV
jgi:hypothetical protein